MKKVLITGAATGIGKACAELFLKNGYEVFATYHNTPCNIDGVTAVKCDLADVDGIKALFDEALVISGGQRQLYVTLGQFSIVRLEREAQLVVPVLDYAIPCKECCETPGGGEDPCELFSRIPFPAQEFSPGNCDDDNECDKPYQTC